MGISFDGHIVVGGAIAIAIAIGGAGLVAEAAELGPVEADRLGVHPVLVGGGTPFFPRQERRGPRARRQPHVRFRVGHLRYCVVL